MISKFVGKTKKIHHSQGQRPYLKCEYMRRGCPLIVVRTHMDYFFPTEKENVFSSQQSIHFIQTSEF